MNGVERILAGESARDILSEFSAMSGPGGMKCTSCDWQGSCDELVDGKCPECNGEVKQVGRGVNSEESCKSEVQSRLLLGIPTREALKGLSDPIFSSASTDDVAALKNLIDSGIDVNTVDSYGSTPLHYAATSGSYKAAKYLISAGADINASDDKGRTPLHSAAISSHSLRVLDLLLKKKAKMEVKQSLGMTPLLLAVAYNRPSAALMLIKAGADVNAKSDNGKTVLDSAPAREKKLTDALRQAGAKYDWELDRK